MRRHVSSRHVCSEFLNEGCGFCYVKREEGYLEVHVAVAAAVHVVEQQLVAREKMSENVRK
eukprot:2927142-Rhodomonas_salina.2